MFATCGWPPLATWLPRPSAAWSSSTRSKRNTSISLSRAAASVGSFEHLHATQSDAIRRTQGVGSFEHLHATQSDALRVGSFEQMHATNQTHSGWHSQGGGTLVTDDERNQMLRADDERNQAQSGTLRVADDERTWRRRNSSPRPRRHSARHPSRAAPCSEGWSRRLPPRSGREACTRASRALRCTQMHSDALRCTCMQMHSDALSCTRASRAHALGRLPACSVAP